MLSVVKENKISKTSNDINEIRRWLRFHGLEVNCKDGWHKGKEKFGAIYYDGEPNAKWRGVIWLNQ